jgi:hypothetical protein
MDTPEPPSEEDELLVPKPGAGANRRVRKKRSRPAKDTMYAIELHRRTLRIRLMIALGVLVFAAAVAALVAWYPGTNGFRGRLDQMILNSTGARVELENVVLTPFGASADRFEAKWADGNFLDSLSAERLSASVQPQRYFGRTYGGNEVQAATGTLTLRFPDAEATASVIDGVAGKSRVSFNRVGIRKLDVQFGEIDAAGSARLVDSEVAFYPEGPSGVPRALLYSGKLELPYWPRLFLERAILDFPAERSQITGMRIRDKLPDSNHEALIGWADISGEFSHDPAEVSTLQLALDGFQIQAIIGEEAGRFFVGRVDTRADEDAGVIRISQDEGLQMRANLVASPMSEFTFKHFPFFAFIARAIDDRWFLNPVFDDGPSMVLVRDGGDMLFDEIHFTSRHRMAIRGSFSIDSDNVIGGEIEVGLTSTVIDAAVARRLDGMFSAERDGFRWVKLELGGTTKLPTDNFNAQFIEAPMPEIERPQFIVPDPEPDTGQEPAPEPQRPTRPPSVLPLLDLDEE